MSDYRFSFHSAQLSARGDGALWWPDRGVLCVSDLHLGKSERIARRGGSLLPPYETEETLWRLKVAIEATTPTTVVCLGDSFDDLSAANALPDAARQTLLQMQAGRDWIWIEGNHDPGPVDIGGRHLADWAKDGLTFRHIAAPHESQEISGHYHPKAAPKGLTRRACFLLDENRLIMPAFGAYTGGMSVDTPPLSDLVQPTGVAILIGKQATPVPLTACIKR